MDIEEVQNGSMSVSLGGAMICYGVKFTSS